VPLAVEAVTETLPDVGACDSVTLNVSVVAPVVLVVTCAGEISNVGVAATPFTVTLVGKKVTLAAVVLSLYKLVVKEPPWSLSELLGVKVSVPGAALAATVTGAAHTPTLADGSWPRLEG
jgi:hypothetical protein